MISFPHAKINLGLRIISRCSDGYHNIETIMLPIGLCDVLEVIPSKTHPFKMTCSGISLPDNGRPNACIQAFEAMQQLLRKRKDHEGLATKPLPSFNAHLHKCIPAGSGLGGGSSDAASMLQMLNTIFSLELTGETLLKLAAGIGCDCIFFMHELLNQSGVPAILTKRQPLLATSRGDVLEKINIPVLENRHLLLVHPQLHISTAASYAMITPSGPCQSLREITSQSIHTWKQTLKNDFEPVVFQKHPEIESIKHKLYEIGALYASMTGSGSSVYGLFDNAPTISRRTDFPGCNTWLEKLTSYPAAK